MGLSGIIHNQSNRTLRVDADRRHDRQRGGYTPLKDVQAVNDEERERSSGVHLSRVSGEEGQVNRINQRWVI